MRLLANFISLQNLPIRAMLILPIFTALIIMITLLAAAPIAQSADDPPRIIFVSHARDYSNHWTIFRNGLVAGMNRLNLNIEMRNPPTGNLEDMDRLVKSAISANPDGLILTMPREALARQWVMAAQAKNIPVILVGSSGISHFENQGRFPLISIGFDQYQAGFSAGIRLKNANLKNAICLVPRIDVDEYLLRCRGVSDAIGHKMPIFSLEKIASNINEFFAAYQENNPELQAVIMTETDHLKALYTALRHIKRTDIGIATFGLTRKSAYLIRRKEQILFAIDSQPFLQGYLTAMIYSNYYHHGVLWGGSHVSTGADIITSGNVASIIHLRVQSDKIIWIQRLNSKRNFDANQFETYSDGGYWRRCWYGGALYGDTHYD